MHEPDRLHELRRQRTLMQEHLAWLDREIAAELGQTEATERATPIDVPVLAPPVAGQIQARADSKTVMEQEAETAMAEYRIAPQDIQQDVRKGCLIYFAIGFLLFAAAVVGMYFALQYGKAK